MSVGYHSTALLSLTKDFLGLEFVSILINFSSNPILQSDLACTRSMLKPFNTYYIATTTMKS